jgi:hypothetical protein
VKPILFLSAIAATGLIAVSSFSGLRAQDAPAAGPSTDLTSGTETASGPGSPTDATAPTTPDAALALDQTLYGEDQATADAPPEPVTQTRPWKFNLHASLDSHYDDNVFISSVAKQSDIVTRLTAGGGFTVGDYTDKHDNYLISDYTGIGELFGRHSNQDAYEQNASIDSLVRLAHLTLHGSFQFQDLADEDIDVGTRTRRQIYTGNFGARYDISDKTYLELTDQVTIANYDLYLDSTDERGGLSFNYLPDPSLTIGLGAMAGILSVQDSGSQTYEQLLASLQVDLTSKLTLKASAGVEDRQLQTNGDLTTPIFDLAGDYKPLDGLDLTLTAYRRVLNSAFYSGYDYIATGVGVGAAYQFTPRFTLLLGGGYENTSYRSTTTGASISRKDDYFYARPALRYVGSEYWNIELYYYYRKDNSTLSTSTFEDTQTGAAVNFTY